MLAGMMERFKTKKSLGQHFLNNASVPRWLCEAGEVSADDAVVEVGPGTGALTTELLARGARVIALEADPRAIEVLRDRFKNEIEAGRLDIRHTDVRRFEIGALGLADHSFKVVANIPYYLTGQLFRAFLAGPVQPSTLVFLVQKEVGKRATASLSRGEKESLLSLSIQAFGKPEYVRSVGRGHFTPPPKVDSAIVAIRDINRDNFQNLAADRFFRILHLGFGSKRKQLLGNLSKEYERGELIDLFSAMALPADVRAEDVPLAKWLELSGRLKTPATDRLSHAHPPAA